MTRNQTGQMLAALLGLAAQGTFASKLELGNGKAASLTRES